MAVRPKPLEHADRLLARAVFWIVFALFVALFGGPPSESDRTGELVHQATRSLALGSGLLLVGDTPESANLVANGVGLRPVDGGAVADVEPVLAAAGVPFHLLGSQLAHLLPRVESVHAASSSGAGARSEYVAHLFVALRSPLCAALAVWTTCLAALRLGARRRTAFTGALALAFSTCLLPASTVVDAQAQSACLASASLYALLLVRDRFYRLHVPGPWHWLLLGGLLGATAATDPALAPAVALLAFSAVRMSVRGRKRLWSMPLLRGGAGAQRSLLDMAWFALPLVGFGLVWWWGHRERTGATDLAPLAHLLPLSEWPAQFAGLLLSPGKGLLWLAPVALFAFVGHARFRQEPRLLSFTLFAPLLVLAVAAATGRWSDPSTFAPSGAAAALVLAWPAVVVGYDLLRERAHARVIGAVLAFVGLCANVGGVAISRNAWRDVVEAAATDLYPAGPEASTRAFAERVAFDWRTAAPWFGWRALRHRTAAIGGEFAIDLFPSHHVLLFEGGGPYGVRAGRDRGFAHLCWVDFEQRLDGRMWPVVLLLALALGGGIVAAVASLDPTRP